MQQQQQSFVKKPCCYHKFDNCIMACFNTTCQSDHLLCAQCLKENKHSGHNQDLKSISEMISQINYILNQCGDFIALLQIQIDQIQQKMNKLKREIQQKFEMKEGRIKQLDSKQISQVLSEMFKFNQTKEHINSEIIITINNSNQILDQCLQELNLDSITYLEISDEQIKLAKTLYEQGYKLYYPDFNYQEAMKLFNQSLDLNPNDYVTLWNKGECLRLLGQYNESVTWIEKALEIEPKYVSSLYSKSESLRMLGKYNESLIWSEKALQINPRHVNSLFSKGDSLKMLGKYHEALTWLNKALEIDPKHKTSLSSKGGSLIMLGKYFESMCCIDLALEIDPRHVTSLYSRGNILNNEGQCLQVQGKYQEAIIWYSKALNIKPNYSLALQQQSILYILLEFCQDKLGIN